MSKHKRVGCQKHWDWGEEGRYLSSKILLCTWVIEKPVGTRLECYLSNHRHIYIQMCIFFHWKMVNSLQKRSAGFIYFHFPIRKRKNKKLTLKIGFKYVPISRLFQAAATECWCSSWEVAVWWARFDSQQHLGGVVCVRGSETSPQWLLQELLLWKTDFFLWFIVQRTIINVQNYLGTSTYGLVDF